MMTQSQCGRSGNNSSRRNGGEGFEKEQMGFARCVVGNYVAMSGCFGGSYATGGVTGVVYAPKEDSDLHEAERKLLVKDLVIDPPPEGYVPLAGAVPGKTILVTTHPLVRGDAQSGYRTADMVFVSTGDGQVVAATQIIGLHPATQHYRVDRCIVEAGQDAVVYVKTPDPELGSDTTIYLSIGKTFSLGNYTGKLKIDRVYDGGLKKTSSPLVKEKGPRFLLLLRRGLRITAPTPS